MKLKQLNFGLKVNNGTNNKGRITVFHRGGGVKRSFRLIDFGRFLKNMKGYVCEIIYDPNRTAFIS